MPVMLNRRQAGEAAWTERGAGKPHCVVGTIQCCHCDRHWVPVAGSGRVRGFCQNCNGFVCGAKACEACVPAEQKLENMERGLPLFYRPVVVLIDRPTRPILRPGEKFVKTRVAFKRT